MRVCCDLLELASEESAVSIEIEITSIVTERLFELSSEFEEAEENRLQLKEASVTTAKRL